MNKISSNLSSVSSSGLIDSKLEEHQLCGSKQCPSCGHKFEGKPDWLGLPAGVKFDPTDQELMEHLEAKTKDTKSHPLIDEFILTIEGEDGICYTHPEKLPGVSRDGLSRHFFHRPSKAYTTGTRKRRKIQTECDHLQQQQGGETRWHKTGKTRPVSVNGKQKGCKKILVLYTNFGKNRKPEKTNWVMHQYHLGQNEEEREGELVVSKIFYQTQPRQCNWSERSATTTTTNGGEGSGEPNNYSGSGSCSSSKEVITQQRDEMNAPMTSSFTNALDIHQQLKSDHFSFFPFRKTNFHEVGIGEGLRARDQVHASAGSCEEVIHEHAHVVQQHHHHQHQQQQQQQIETTSFHMNMMSSRPLHPISTIISPSPAPPPPLHHSTSINIINDNNNSYQVSTMMQLQNDHFHQQHDDDKLGGRSASGLEELIMGCTSTSTHTNTNTKEESPMTMANPQEAEWLKYSSYWPDPDNPNHHHHH